MELNQCSSGRSYIEAVHLFYSTITFVFPDLSTFKCFERLVPRSQFHGIKRMSLAWNYGEVGWDFEYNHLPCPSNEQTWKEVCKAVSEMRGLEFVRVLLENCPGSPYQDSDLDLQQPLWKIQKSAMVELFVYGEKKELTRMCGCGCGRTKNRCYGSQLYEDASPEPGWLSESQ